MTKRALITGIRGQTGHFLTSFLIEKGYEIIGIADASKLERFDPFEDMLEGATIKYGNICDKTFVKGICSRNLFDEVYHLAAITSVADSIKDPEQTMKVNVEGTKNLLMSLNHFQPDARVFLAGSSEMFGTPKKPVQTEKTPFAPQNPYGKSKVAAYDLGCTFGALGMYIAQGILYNHESEIRSKTFLSGKVANNVAKIKLGKKKSFTVGNVDAVRDWGYVTDFVKGMWQMLQQDQPGMYVLATNESHTVAEFISAAFQAANIPIKWEGSGENAVAKTKNGDIVVQVDPKFYRPNDDKHLQGNYSKAKQELGWKPKISFEEIAKRMVNHHISQLEGKLNMPQV